MALNLLVVLITIVSALLIASILIQNPKGGGIDASMGGSASQMFGATRSADFVEKATWYLGGALLVQGNEPPQNLVITQVSGPAIGSSHRSIKFFMPLFQNEDSQSTAPTRQWPPRAD